MKSRALRGVLFVLVLAAYAGAGYAIWRAESHAAAERGIAESFDRQARQCVLALADLRAAFQAYVADGQAVAQWQQTAQTGVSAVGANLAALRAAARAPEAQGAIEAAVEHVGSLAKSDSRAREYLDTGQRLSASDIVFAEVAPITTKAANAVELARGQESIASATILDTIRMRQLYALAGAALTSLVDLLLLLPIPAAGDAATAAADAAEPSEGLGLSHIVPTRNAEARQGPAPGAPLAGAAETAPGAPAPAATPGVDLAAAAEVCVSLARVREPRDLPAALERAAEVLGAVGVVVWMPDGPHGALRPALAHGYTPMAVTRMGAIPADADNAMALAFRTAQTQTVPPDAGSAGAVAAPLVTSDGCSGVLAAELARPGHLDQVRAVATILAAQLATLISPSGQGTDGSRS